MAAMRTTSWHGAAALGIVVLRPALRCTKGTVSAPHEADAAEDLVGAHDKEGAEFLVFFVTDLGLHLVFEL